MKADNSFLPRAAWALALAAILRSAPASAACSVYATPVSFGTFAALKGAITSVGTVSFTCTGAMPAGIKIVMGPGRSGSIKRRVMIGARSRLPYLLSFDPRGLALWGDGSEGTQVYFDPHPPRNRTVTIRVYGHILPGEQAEPNNVYRDNVSVVAFY